MAVIRDAGYIVRNNVMRAHPRVSISGDFVNAIYELNYGGYTIEISDTCKVSIDDYATVKEDKNGKMIKETAKDPVTKKPYEINGHFSDTKRYFICKVLEKEFMFYISRKQRRGSVAA
jgi:hypothetical protein